MENVEDVKHWLREVLNGKDLGELRWIVDAKIEAARMLIEIWKEERKDSPPPVDGHCCWVEAVGARRLPPHTRG